MVPKVKVCRRSATATARTNAHPAVLLVMSHVVILPTLNEGAYLSRTLASLEIQTCRSETLVVDSHSTDKTREVAEKFDCKVIDAPRGKLNARHLGILKAEADIIVSCDADTIYPPRWLENTIAAFKDDSVVGVTGPRLYSNVWVNDAQRAFYEYCWRFFGSNSAFLRKAYFMSGGFNLSIDQQDSKKMVDEEEVLFKERLQAFGKVVYQPDNPIITSARRFGSSDKDFKDQVKAKQRF